MTIDEICKEYKENYFAIQELDELLKQGNSFENWLENMKSRSQRLEAFYRRNNELLEMIQQYETVPFSSDEEASFAYDQIVDMYKSYVDDPTFLLPAVRKLISFYEKKKDISRIVYLYYMAFYEINEIESRGSGGKVDLTYQLKTLELKRYYRSLDVKLRRCFFLVYYNLCSVSVGMKAVSPQESYFWYKEAKEFFYSDVVQPIDKDTPEIREEIERIQYDWIAIIDNAQDLSVEALSELFSLITDLYEQELEATDPYEIDSFLYSSYLEMEYLKRNKNLGEIIEEYMEYFRVNVRRITDRVTEDDFYLISESPFTIERWLSKAQDTFFKRRIFEEINDVMLQNWERFSRIVPTTYINEMLANWCEISLKYLDSKKEKENALLNLVIKHQIPTYLHSVMVMHLSEKLFEVSYRKKPELYRDLHMSYDELHDFVTNASLLHDIGKIKITDIINRQGRRLSQAEFEGICRHPQFGIHLIEEDKDLSVYADVIRYHHKYYDGSKGYPFGNENLKSKYRIIIDLITICDCVDAATDFLGRNYKRSKTVAEVLEELKQGSGERYNPELVKILEGSQVLQTEFVSITADKRARFMYDAYIKSREIVREE